MEQNMRFWAGWQYWKKMGLIVSNAEAATTAAFHTILAKNWVGNCPLCPPTRYGSGPDLENSFNMY